jgi:hypothetical protein
MHVAHDRDLDRLRHRVTVTPAARQSTKRETQNRRPTAPPATGVEARGPRIGAAK